MSDDCTTLADLEARRRLALVTWADLATVIVRQHRDVVAAEEREARRSRVQWEATGLNREPV